MNFACELSCSARRRGHLQSTSPNEVAKKYEVPDPIGRRPCRITPVLAGRPRPDRRRHHSPPGDSGRRTSAERARQRRARAHRLQPGDHQRLHSRRDPEVDGRQRWRREAADAPGRGSRVLHPAAGIGGTDDERSEGLGGGRVRRCRAAALGRANRAEVSAPPDLLQDPRRRTRSPDHRQHDDRPARPAGRPAPDRDRSSASRRRLDERERLLRPRFESPLDDAGRERGLRLARDLRDRLHPARRRALLQRRRHAQQRLVRLRCRRPLGLGGQGRLGRRPATGRPALHQPSRQPDGQRPGSVLRQRRGDQDAEAASSGTTAT